MSISNIIIQRLKDAKHRFFANDNVASFIKEGELALLEEELTAKFEEVLKSLIIDTEHDPNSSGTAKRMAKMYLHEIMKGRYHQPPKVTSFPNEKVLKSNISDNNRPAFSYSGLLIVKAELKSLCAHHHQVVDGIAYIGIIPGKKVIGLSKYIRIAQHLARRGTLQEQLTEDILKGVQQAASTEDVAVYVKAKHGCVSHRGVAAHDSSTQTVELGGAFYSEPELRKEFYDAISLQQRKED